MKILVVNDDGITAPGIQALVEVAKDFGEVTVVAPDKPQSGMGHAITVNSMLRVHPFRMDGITAYACSGTPVDCVKLAVDVVFKNEKPDWVFSGINHGANHSINVIYSGTMSAAIEAAIEGIPAIGFSLCDFSIEADFSVAKKYARIIIEQAINTPWEKNVCLNVNIPRIDEPLVRGIKICRQAKAFWKEEFDERIDPSGKPYYWLTGKFVSMDEGTDHDVWALENNYVSVVPIQVDLTDYSMLDKLKKWEKT
ncbi:MAG: 5'-nucleotidase SurE [Vicingaceae bacterium]|nr:MAG: 5'-nucleotidase SurE [Vicingaceae bacterium]